MNNDKIEETKIEETKIEETVEGDELNVNVKRLKTDVKAGIIGSRDAAGRCQNFLSFSF